MHTDCPPVTADLISRLRARDENAVAELAREYGPRVHQLALRYLKNVEDAEEITQDVLLKAYQKIADFRGRRRAVVVAVPHCLQHRDVAASALQTRAIAGSSSRRRAATGRAAGSHEVPDPSVLADEALVRRQLRQRLARAVRELPAHLSRADHPAGFSGVVDRGSEQRRCG